MDTKMQVSESIPDKGVRAPLTGEPKVQLNLAVYRTVKIWPLSSGLTSDPVKQICSVTRGNHNHNILEGAELLGESRESLEYFGK